MNVESARRVMETTCPDTANQYLRFGWKLINQYVVEATADAPATVRYVLASVRRLDDTRQVVTLTDPAAVNEYLELGWKLIDKHVAASTDPQRRDETLHFVLAWQSDDQPQRPGAASAADRPLEGTLEADEELSQ
ncbi:MAG: hypothetical protein WD063_14360 [Pirellulales bacterium]